MKNIGNIVSLAAQVSGSSSGKTEGATEKPAQGGHGAPPGAANSSAAAQFAQIKETWAMQVAADKRLPGTALRIALVWPLWLNSKSLLAWPAQDTIAKAINCSVRTVRGALKSLEDHDHLACVSMYRGGRMSNRYRIVVHDEVVCAPGTQADHDETGSPPPVSPEGDVRSGRQARAGHPGTAGPVSTEGSGRGTPERTSERTHPGTFSPVAANDPEGPSEARVSKEQAAEIMRDHYGPARVLQGRVVS